MRRLLATVVLLAVLTASGCHGNSAPPTAPGSALSGSPVGGGSKVPPPPPPPPLRH